MSTGSFRGVNLAIRRYFRAMAENFLSLEGVSVQVGGVQILNNVHLTIHSREQWALVGPSGSGKTVLAHTLLGRHFYSGKLWYGDPETGEKREGREGKTASLENNPGEMAGGVSEGGETLSGRKPRVAIVEQQHRFRNRTGMADLYYQQRFNSSDADQTMTVEQELAAYTGWMVGGKGAEGLERAGGEGGDEWVEGQDRVEGEGTGETVEGQDRAKGERADEGAGTPDQGNRGTEEEWLDSLHIRPLLSRPLIQLSNGENKRVQLAIALLKEPDLLILDNPFLGLDTEGRKVLHIIIDMLSARGMQLLLITHAGELPATITHVASLDNGSLSFAGPKSRFRPKGEEGQRAHLDPDILRQLQALQDLWVTDEEHAAFATAVKMVDVTVTYGEKVLLQHISWEVKKGERWNVSGPNGAGKSTLLSLITADNPQAYANEIWLFDRRRGSGETIWEIKQKIGFVSPELHLYFDYSATCFEVVASGLFDTIGLFKLLSQGQEEHVLLWMQLLSLTGLRSKRLAQLSTGQQRMVLLARALIKNPPMLILDEPCQGLDEEQTSYFRELIGLLCEAFGKTLIYVSHYRQEIPDCVDRFLKLEDGRMVE